MAKRYYGYKPGWYVIDDHGNLYGPCGYIEADLKIKKLAAKGIFATYVILREED